MKQSAKSILLFVILLSGNLKIYAQYLGSEEYNAKKNLAGKVYFSKESFVNSSTGSLNNFSSSDFIYARLETNGKKLNELLDLPGQEKDKLFDQWFLYYYIRVYKDGKLLGFNAGRKVWVLKNISFNSTALNFDVLPSPQSVSTFMVNGDPDSYDERRDRAFAGPLYDLIIPRIFTESGNYHVKVEVFDITKDDWQKLEKPAKWPSFEGEFDFTFNTADITRMQENETAAAKVLNGRLQKAREDALHKKGDEIREAYYNETEPPAGWALKSNVIGGGLTMAQIKNYFSKNLAGTTILKVYATENNGWRIGKNDLGIPTYKYLDQEVRVFYKVGGDTCSCQSIYLRQPYLGGGRYDKTRLSVFSSSPFSCLKLK